MSSQLIRIADCQYLDGDTLCHGNVELSDNRIKIYNGNDFDHQANGQLLLPGLVDLAARSAKLSHIQAAAEQSGVTQYCLLPNSSNPVIDDAAVVHAMQLKTAANAPDALLLGAATQQLKGQQLAEMAALKKAGCVALSDAGQAWQSNLTLKRAMEYARSIDVALHLTAQDKSLADAGCAHDGAVAAQLGLPSIPSSSESGALAMMLEMVEETGARVHFNHLSTARSVRLMRRAKKRGLRVTADVSIHNLVLNESAISGYNTLCHVLPPLRAESDRQALIEGINQGWIDAITSHHEPCSDDDKLQPFPASRPGIAALDLLLALTINVCEQDTLNLSSALRALTTQAAAVIGRQPKHWWLCDLSTTVQVIDKPLTPYYQWSLTLPKLTKLL